MFDRFKNLQAEDWYLGLFLLLLLQLCVLCSIASITSQIKSHTGKIESFLTDWEVEEVE